jgi:hypothetical protein
MVKHLGKIIFSLPFLILLLLSATTGASACQSLTKTPETGPPGTKFAIQAHDCEKINFSGYTLRITRNDTGEEVVTRQMQTRTQDSPTTYTAVFNAPDTGEYTATIWQIGSGNIPVDISLISASLIVSAQDDSNRDNTYSCEIYQGKCKLITSRDSCLSGYYPGSLCATTALGLCRDVSYPCSTTETAGQENQPCKSGEICNAGLYCDLDAGFICKRCGGAGEACCPGPQLPCVSGNVCINGICEGDEPNRGDYFKKQLLCNSGLGINTAVGCISFADANELVAFFLRWGVGLGGGIAFLLMVYAGFTIMTSTGNPERLKGGQQLLTSAVAGLIMLIFSIFILRLIGVNILQIPGFGS